MTLSEFLKETRKQSFAVTLNVTSSLQWRTKSLCPYERPVCPCCPAEISNLLVVTKDRVLTHPSPMPDSQLSFHRILKDDVEQVQPLSPLQFCLAPARFLLHHSKIWEMQPL